VETAWLLAVASQCIEVTRFDGTSGLASIREVDSWHLNGERTKTSTLGVHAVASLFGIVVALHV
jgi:hypothetical protein